MVTLTKVVEPGDTARAVGSGDLEVLGTPVLTAWFEEATCAALDLAPDETSVGTRVTVMHHAASPVGMAVDVTARVISTEGRSVVFAAEAVDVHGTRIGEAEVGRVIVDRTRFLDRLPGVTP